MLMDKSKNTETKGSNSEESDGITLYCMDCGAALDWRDEKCYQCGAYQ